MTARKTNTTAAADTPAKKAPRKAAPKEAEAPEAPAPEAEPTPEPEAPAPEATPEVTPEAQPEPTPEAPAAEAPTHIVHRVDGTPIEVRTRHYGKAVRFNEKWLKPGQEKWGHEVGDYSDHADPLVGELAYAWRTSGQSVDKGFRALKLQSGAALCNAADRHAKANELATAIATRAVQKATKQAEVVPVETVDVEAIAPKESATA